MTMVQSRINAMKALGLKSTENAKNKDRMKKTIGNTTKSDFAIEMVNQMAKNCVDAQDDRIKYVLALMKVESDVTEKNVQLWITFMKEIADGKTDDDVLEEGD